MDDSDDPRFSEPSDHLIASVGLQFGSHKLSGAVLFEFQLRVGMNIPPNGANGPDNSTDGFRNFRPRILTRPILRVARKPCGKPLFSA